VKGKREEYKKLVQDMSRVVEANEPGTLHYQFYLKHFRQSLQTLIHLQRPWWVSYGPLQSNGICLLDLPFLSHLNPIASTSSAVAVPHVATAPAVPGPTSLPGGFIV
jgi:hypothetical protein